jgi:hypothetical protein
MTRTPCRLAAAIALFAVAGTGLAAPARADQASSQACAKTLPPEAMTIYRTLAPQVTPSTDLMSLMKSQVKMLVMQGQVERATARSSAKQAYPCLKELK